MTETFDNDLWDYLNESDEEEEPDIDQDRERHSDIRKAKNE